MLTIRRAQIAILSQLEVQKFEEWMLVHLKKFFPRQCAAAGDRRLREMVQHGIQRAAAYGITARRDVCKYIDLRIVFGRDSIRTGDPCGRERSSPNAEIRALRCRRYCRPRRCD